MRQIKEERLIMNKENVNIKQLDPSDLPAAVEVIRASFATVAKEFNITEENCPDYVAFVTTTERLQNHFNWGWFMYGLYAVGRDDPDAPQMVGYVSLSKKIGEAGVFELHNLAVLPEYRHKSYGKQLIERCKSKVKELGGNKIKLGMIEENTVLKNWYAANGFIHTGFKWFKNWPFKAGFMEWEG